MNDKLNVLWVLADELRCDSLSCYGARQPEITTPFIDRVAREGTLFRQAFTASPVCVPARVAMATGLSPFSSGVLNNEAQGKTVGLAADTWSQALGRAGWFTANFGKEHLPADLQPWELSNEEGAGMGETLAQAKQSGAQINRTPLGQVYSAVIPDEVDFYPERITRNVIKALTSSTAPFLIRASYLQPHKPTVLPRRWAARYADLDFAVDTESENAPCEFERRLGQINAGQALTSAQVNEANAMYYSSVAWLDYQVGQLCEALKALDLYDKTIIVLTSDHGANLGEYGSFGKHTFTRNSHQVPLIVRPPLSRHQAAQEHIGLVSSEDLGSIILGLLGQSHLLESMQPDGNDALKQSPPPHIVSIIGYGEDTSVAYPNLGEGSWASGSGWPQRICVRTGAYRYDRNTLMNGARLDVEQQDRCLIDCVRDPFETTNLLADKTCDYSVLIDKFEAIIRDRLATERRTTMYPGSGPEA